MVEVQGWWTTQLSAAIHSHIVTCTYTPLTSLSPDEATPQQRLAPLLHFHFATAAKAQVKLDYVSLYMTIEPLTQSPPLSAAATATSNNPSARFAFPSYALLTLLRGVSVDAVGLEDDWDIKQVDNIARAGRSRRGFTSFRPHAEGHWCQEEGEAKAFWMAIVRGLGVFGLGG